MGNLIFKDSKTTRSKTLVMAKPEDDIVLILPDNPGILATTNTLSQELYGGDTPIDISNILKPNILENNGGIVDSTSNNKPLERASYRTTNAYKGKLDYTEWIAATDALFKNIIDHTTDREHVDSWLPNIGTPSTKVFVRYRFLYIDIRCCKICYTYRTISIRFIITMISNSYSIVSIRI